MHSKVRLAGPLIILTVLAAVIAASCTSSPPTDGLTGSRASTEGTATVPQTPEAGLPAKGKSFRDAAFGAVLRRITDKKTDRYDGPGIQNEYSRVDPENADGSRLILRGNDGSWYLYETEDLRLLANLSPVFKDCGQEPEPRWDCRDTSLFYFVCNTQLRSYDVSTKRSRTLHDFSEEVPGVRYVRTRSEGEPSRDRRYWAFLAEDEEWRATAVITYDATTDEVIGRRDDFPDELDWVGMDASGDRCLVGYANRPELLVMSHDMKRTVPMPRGSNAHGDIALSKEGKDVWVCQNTATDKIAVIDLQTGRETALLDIPFGINPDIGLHVSGNCYATPGWVLVSTYGSKDAPPGKKHSWMDNQLFMLELRSDPRVIRLARTNCYTSIVFDDEKQYFAEAYATVNESGTRAYFGSNWGRVGSDYTDAYQLLLPEGWERP